MIVTAAIIGALLGWVFAHFDPSGFWLGALVGAAVGWAMRFAVRREAAAVSEQLWRQWHGKLTAELQNAAATAPLRTSPPEPRAPSPTDAAPAVQADRAARASFPVAGPAIPFAKPPAPPSPSAEPSAFELAFDRARLWLLGGNTVVRIGLLLLFVGLSFLARYAAAAGIFPIELRLALVALFGVALLGVGFHTRSRRPDFGLSLQGGGIAVIYLTVFAAARFFSLLPLAPAFGVMVVVCALACALALLQNSQGLAAAAFAGGFATPLLLGGDGASPLIPFGYYTLLNLAVLFIAARRAWRWLNLLGFFATFGAATLWGFAAYSAAQYWPAQIFLVLSVLIYVVAGVLYARRTLGKLGNPVDGTLLFGPALAGFGLQAGLVRHLPFATAFSALGFAALYLFTATAIGRRRDQLNILREGAIAVGIGFITLAVPLALGARWTSSAWALEGAGAVWLGMRQARWLSRAFGQALQAVAAMILLVSLPTPGPGAPLLDPDFIGLLLVALPLLATAWWLRLTPAATGGRWALGYARVETVLAPTVFLFGFAVWCGAWTSEAARVFLPTEGADTAAWISARSAIRLAAMLAFVASAWGAAAIGRRFSWAAALWPSRATLAALGLTLLSELSQGRHVLLWPGVAVWAAVITIHFWLLRLNDRDSDAPSAWLTATHVGGVWLAVGIVADAAWLGIDQGALWRTSWAGVSFLASIVAVLALLTLWAGRPRAGWPLDRHGPAYLWTAAVPVAVLVAVGALFTALIAAGDTAPLAYIPLLNPVDLSVALAVAALLYWRRRVRALEPAPVGSAALRGSSFLPVIAYLVFVAVNSVWLRIAHHYLAVPWNVYALLGNVVVETGLAILWTLLALALMVVAHRRAVRGLWLVGAGLLGLTVAKLLLVDLNNVGGAARIVAFIGVGVLMLVVGYLAPLPPRRRAEPDKPIKEATA